MSIVTPAHLSAEEMPENNPPMGLTGIRPKRVLHGGMSSVYLCEPGEGGGPWGRDVAVKRMKYEIAARSGAPERFLHECYLWLQLGEHPHVTQALSAHQAPHEPPLLVLEYLPASLRDPLRRGALDLRNALRLLINIGEGLAYVRGVLPGFVHGDLKPENVLIDERDQAKITDLGLARIVTESVTPGTDADTTSAPASASSAGSTGNGTPLYMAPEQITERSLPASDIYAIGCIAHEVVSGEPTYGRPSSVADYMMRHLHRRPTSLDRLVPGTPTALAQLICAMLDKSPTGRPDLGTAIGEFRAIAAALGVRVPFPRATPVPLDRGLTAAQGLVNLGLHLEARQTAEKLVDLTDEADDRIWIHTLLARCHNDSGNALSAELELDRASTFMDQSTASVNVAAYCAERCKVAMKKGDTHKALEYAIQGIRAEPQASVGYANAAMVYERLGDADSAIESLRIALSISRDFRYFSGLINVLREAGRGSEAIQVSDQMISAHPTLAQAYALHGLTHLLVASDNAQQMTQKTMEDLDAVLAEDLAAAERYGSHDLPATTALRQLLHGSESHTRGHPSAVRWRSG
ncbi:protein kinase [Streptomyces sp. NPDC006368]|uniref:protein kinase domain-containing protein n=1 Tax=Streptomyces sp. NPDC006368 TaxID=3156760 RepID=UPI0033A2DD8E